MTLRMNLYVKRDLKMNKENKEQLFDTPSENIELLALQQENERLKEEVQSYKNQIDEFINIENKVNASINTEKSIIATGGSVVYGKEAMEHLSEIGTVIYLKLDLDSLSKRLGSLEKRGVVLKDGQTLEDLFNERTPLYEKYADIIINEHGYTIQQTVKLIEAKLGV